MLTNIKSVLYGTCFFIYLIIIFMIQRIYYLLPNILLFKNNCNRVNTDKKAKKNYQQHYSSLSHHHHSIFVYICIEYSVVLNVIIKVHYIQISRNDNEAKRYYSQKQKKYKINNHENHLKTYWHIVSDVGLEVDTTQTWFFKLVNTATPIPSCVMFLSCDRYKFPHGNLNVTY